MIVAARLPRLALAFSLALLAACSTMQPPEPSVSVLSGRLAWQAGRSGEAATQRASAQFELRGDALRGQLELTGPLGTLVARARWQPDGAELSTAEGTRRHASLQALSEAAFGEPFPLQALFDWLRGRPWAGAPHEAAPGGFEQLGWLVDTSGLAQGALTAQRGVGAEPPAWLRVRLDGPP